MGFIVEFCKTFRKHLKLPSQWSGIFKDVLKTPKVAKSMECGIAKIGQAEDVRSNLEDV